MTEEITNMLNVSENILGFGSDNDNTSDTDYLKSILGPQTLAYEVNITLDYTECSQRVPIRHCPVSMDPDL